MFTSRTSKFSLVLAVALVLGIATYAFAASNTLPDTMAGQGSTVISGYNITSVAYNLNAATPGNIDSVTFTLSAAATTVKMSLVSGTWYNCSVLTGNNWSCATTSPQATVSAANNLDIIAKDH